MARINLLPWRETDRIRRRKELAVMAAAAVGVTLAAALGLHLHLERVISLQESRNVFLQEQIEELDRQIKEIKELEKTKADLLARMEVIQQLQHSRPEVVHLFDELVVTIPDGVFLTKLDQSGRTVVVEGHAQSNARVSAFMRNLDGSRWVGDPHLLLIEHRDKTGTGLSHFRLQFSQLQAERGTAPSG